MLLNKLNNDIHKIYKRIMKMSLIQKIVLIFIIIVFWFIFSNNFKKIENYENIKEKFTVKYGNDVYDEFYVSKYDQIFLNEKRNKFEIKEIIKDKPERILDVGSGTGYTVNLLTKLKYKVVGIDKSKEMIKYSKNKYEECKFINKDILEYDNLDDEKYTHILCLGRTIYEISDKNKFFEVCNNLLDFNGYLILNLVNRDKFKPYVPSSNNKILFDPEKYDKKIDQIIIKFDKNNEFISRYELNNNNKDIYLPYSSYIEQFQNFENNVVRKNEIYLYLPEIDKILKMAKENGFEVKRRVNMSNINYDHEYLYFFKKTL